MVKGIYREQSGMYLNDSKYDMNGRYIIQMSNVNDSVMYKYYVTFKKL